MLRYLEIRNIALIDAASIEFGGGLCVLTGETGAGKSIIIDSINAVLGTRVQRDLVRAGADGALVSASFALGPPMLAALAAQGLEFGQGGELVLSREISQSGRSVCRCNGRLVPSALLKAVGEQAVDLHGQHDNHSLLKREKHQELVDNFGGEPLLGAKAAYASLHDRHARMRRELDELARDEAGRAREADMLAYQIDEIRKARLTPKEDERLEAEAKLLANAEKVSDALSRAIALLAGGDAFELYGADGADGADGAEGAAAADDGGGAVGRAQEAARALGQIEPFDPAFGAMAGKLRDAAAEIEDVASSARASLGRAGYDPRRLDSLLARLDLIERLKAKYGGTLKATHAFYKEAVARHAALMNSGRRADELEGGLAAARGGMDEAARRLTALRESASERIERDVACELMSLEMPSARLRVSIESSDDPGSYGPNGRDQVEFLFSANAGEEPKALMRIASGGEMSRVMLAVKSVLADADNIPTMIFDEIDAGIGGAAATRVAEKMHILSRGRQIVCVTHLAQIASMADDHYKIEKLERGGRTLTSVERLGSDGRVEELSRILGGGAPTAASVRLARELLDKAARFKRDARGR